MSTIAGTRLQPSTDLSRSTSNKAAGTPTSVGKKLERKPSQRNALKGRQNSLRRVKDSTDVLREKSLQGQKSKREKGPASDAASSGRDGKGQQFTVGNVGNNGMIYLRPVQKSQNNVPQMSSFNFPDTLPKNGFASGKASQTIRSHERDSVWTRQSVYLRQTPSSHENSHLLNRTRPARSFSQSTIDEGSTHERLDSGALKIVIDRSDTNPGPEDAANLAFPGLEIPIPHYRLGEPRFSEKGTPFLQESIYARSSVTGDNRDKDSSMFAGGDYDGLFPNTPGLEAHAILSRRHSHASPQPYSIQTSFGPSSFMSVASQANNVPSHSGSITPQIYDALAANPNDPAIVRYSPINGDIIAASAARIVVQITSESFLDYELLSDFFLTVRAYLSSHDLLAYLLARFEWAINRFDDNGRIIRVRAFAALRHWILNYFSYDFVVDRDLRVQFCDRVNALTRLVKARADWGASDVKLIADLKKCWNGRCALFWDGLPPASESHQDMDIQPGGVVGSRDSQLIHQSQLRFKTVVPQLGLGPAQITAGSTSIASWYSTVMDHGERQSQGHVRQGSSATSRSLPISPCSEQSIPVLSCSIPAKGFKRAAPYSNKALGIHPIPMTQGGRRICPAAPSSIINEQPHASNMHRRSGSFSDAARDKREPLSAEVPSGAEELPIQAPMFERSLLRGHVLPPCGPYVDPIATTPVHEISKPVLCLQHGKESEHHPSRKAGGSTNPAVKNILGNIRRVLSSKHGGSSATSTNNTSTASGIPSPSLALGKSAALPLNVMFQGAASGQLEAFRSFARVDQLASNIFESYKQSSALQLDTGVGSVSEGNMGSSKHDQTPTSAFAMTGGLSVQQGSDNRLCPPSLQRQNSGMTDSSQSILIVDDTGLNMPTMAPLSIKTAQTNGQAQTLRNKSLQDRLGMLPSSKRADATTIKSQNSTGDQMSSARRSVSSPHIEVVGPGSVIPASTDSLQSQPFNHGRNVSRGTVKSSSVSLRRYASFQSTFSKRGPQKISSSIAPKKSETPVPEGTDQPPTRMLRRRPGGDLRANQNVHDLEEPIRPRSAGSVTTYSESVRGSELLGFGEKIARTFGGRRPSRDTTDAMPENIRNDRRRSQSLVRTHSSQHAKRRPSFEAAVAQFARIPDEDEGGLEITLLKLEGKYKSPIQSPLHDTHPRKTSIDTVDQESDDDEAFDRLNAVLPKGKQVIPTLGEAPKSQPRANFVSTLYAGSEESYNSVPLLERGTEDGDDLTGLGQPERIPRSTPRDQISSGELIYETSSLRRLRHGSTAPTATTDSFLLDENDDFNTDDSSEFSLETIDAEDSMYPVQDHRIEDMVLVGQHHPPSPPMTMDNAISISSQTKHEEQQRKPPTPDRSPISHHVEPTRSGKTVANLPIQPRHMCFVLGFESELLAQQFTLIEKDALKEVDWRDLVDMRWQNTATSTTNWVEYLITQDPLGIDLVTARFNIMVKWALSEIVLTENIEERALTIMKFIHIAKRARELNNYATLLQFTIALTSADCTRLSKTWNVVPDAEKEILQDLEMLVSPRRNFHNLRVEMEKANAEQGCIPVVALYIHDLTYNAQKPSQLPGSRNGEPLINFERYRSTAVIVKNLLRLIDASTKYTYQPIEGVTERCLWMACLTDEVITHKSKQREWNSV